MRLSHLKILPAASMLAIAAGSFGFAGSANSETSVVIELAASAQNDVDQDLVKIGRKEAKRKGCATCHSLDGKKKQGPSWKGIYGQNRQLADGQTVLADEAYLWRAIVDPRADIVKGFSKNLMPKNYGKKLNEKKMKAIIELIKSVR